jgi:GNAT superfamily N-acetyltransferase
MRERRFRLNPEGIEPAYLAALQRAFPGWGGPAEFDWWFRRSAGGPEADMLVLEERDTLVAGMAVVYRIVRAADGRQALAGALTGAWTDPRSRRSGCFSELIQRARETSQAHGATMLLGFMRAGRESRGRMAAAADACIETWALRADGQATGPTPAGSAPGADELQAWFHARPGGIRIAYPTPEIFAERARLERSAVVRCGRETWAIVERRGELGHVHAVVAPPPGPDPGQLAAAIATVGGTAYTSEKAVAEEAVRLGAEATPVYLFLFAPRGRIAERWTAGEWRLQALDRA